MSRTFFAALAGAALFAMPTTTPAAAQSLEPVRYTLRVPAPQTHYVGIETAYPTGRHVEGVSASADGKALAGEKSRKNRWRVTTGGVATVTVRYRVYSREMTVRNNRVESGFAMLNGAPASASAPGWPPGSNRSGPAIASSCWWRAATG